jgi:hypothetical protein
MLNTRALASFALLWSLALLSSIAVSPSFAMQRASDGADAAPQRPVEAYQTGEGVIVLSNRPATPEAEAADSADAATPMASNAVAPAPVSASTSPVAAGEPQAGHAATAAWVGLFVAILALAGAAMLVRRRRTRSTARYAALLAGSEPVGMPDAAPPTAPGPFAPVPVVVEQRPAMPAKSAEERSSPRSAPPPSGISAPPASERQWQSQPPPRNVKDPPE